MPLRENIQKALDAGYSHEDIWSKLQEKDPKIKEALSKGYTPAQIQEKLGLTLRTSVFEKTKNKAIGVIQQQQSIPTKDMTSPQGGISEPAGTMTNEQRAYNEMIKRGYPPEKVGQALKPYSQYTPEESAQLAGSFQQLGPKGIAEKLLPEDNQGEQIKPLPFAYEQIMNLAPHTDFNQMAFRQGVIPLASPEKKPAIEYAKKQNPLPYYGGKLAGFYLSHLLTGGISKAVEHSPTAWLWAQQFGPNVEQTLRIMGDAARNAATFGTKELADQVLNVAVGGDKPTVKGLVGKPLEQAVGGALLGSTAGIESAGTKVKAAAGISAAYDTSLTTIKRLYEKFYEGKKHSAEDVKKDFTNIVLMAGIRAAIRSIGSEKLEEQYKQSRMENHLNNELITRAGRGYTETGERVPWEEAKKRVIELEQLPKEIGGLYKKALEHLARPAYEQVIETKLPGFEGLPKDIKEKLLGNIITSATSGVPLNEAIDKAAEMAKPITDTALTILTMPETFTRAEEDRLLKSDRVPWERKQEILQKRLSEQETTPGEFTPRLDVPLKVAEEKAQAEAFKKELLGSYQKSTPGKTATEESFAIKKADLPSLKLPEELSYAEEERLLRSDKVPFSKKQEIINRRQEEFYRSVKRKEEKEVPIPDITQKTEQKEEAKRYEDDKEIYDWMQGELNEAQGPQRGRYSHLDEQYKPGTQSDNPDWYKKIDLRTDDSGKKQQPTKKDVNKVFEKLKSGKPFKNHEVRQKAILKIIQDEAAYRKDRLKDMEEAQGPELPKPEGATERIDVDALKKGQSVTINGEKFTVKQDASSGGLVVLKDGKEITEPPFGWIDIDKGSFSEISTQKPIERNTPPRIVPEKPTTADKMREFFAKKSPVKPAKTAKQITPPPKTERELIPGRIDVPEKLAGERRAAEELRNSILRSYYPEGKPSPIKEPSVSKKPVSEKMKKFIKPKEIPASEKKITVTEKNKTPKIIIDYNKIKEDYLTSKQAALKGYSLRDAKEVFEKLEAGKSLSDASFEQKRIFNMLADEMEIKNPIRSKADIVEKRTQRAVQIGKQINPAGLAPQGEKEVNKFRSVINEVENSGDESKLINIPEFAQNFDDASIARIHRGIRFEARRNDQAWDLYKAAKKASIEQTALKLKLKKEASDVAEKLKLTRDDLEAITKYRDKLPDAPTKLSPEQKEFNDYLTKVYGVKPGDAYHGLFNVKKFVPENYSPRMTPKDILTINERLINTMYGDPDKVPAQIKEFFKKERTGKLEDIRLNALENLHTYIDIGTKALFFNDVLELYKQNLPKLPPAMKGLMEDYLFRLLGYPSASDSAWSSTIQTVLNKASELHIPVAKSLQNLTDQDVQKLARVMIDIGYIRFMGARPKSAIKNLLQWINNSIPELGYGWTLRGLGRLLFTTGFKEARESGIFLEFAPELYKELESSIERSNWDKTRDLLLCMFQAADRVNRSITYYGSVDKWDYHFKRFEKHHDVSKFMHGLEADKFHKVNQKDIVEAIKKGKYDEARKLYAEEIVGKTQYLYNKEDSPIMTRSAPGKIWYQMQSWKINYAQLLADDTMNKNWKAWTRRLMLYGGLLLLEEQFRNKTPEEVKKLVKNSMLWGPFNYGISFEAIAPALEPLADVFMAGTYPLRKAKKLSDFTKSGFYRDWGKEIGKKAEKQVPVAAKEWYKAIKKGKPEELL